MKTMGLIGGMSWESTVTYYQIVNRSVKEKLGGLHSAKCVMYSVNFAEIEEYQVNGEWEKSAKVLADAAKALEKAGADFVVLCTNTMHKVADQIKAEIDIPFLHIAECTADMLEQNQISKVGLLGTRYTMEQDFYKAKIIDRGIDVLIPEGDDIKTVNDIIYNELCLGEIKESSKQQYLEIIEKLKARGAEGIILGCTEIGLLIQQHDTDISLFDTTEIHAEMAVVEALA